jgi:hypothetical protein
MKAVPQYGQWVIGLVCQKNEIASPERVQVFASIDGFGESFLRWLLTDCGKFSEAPSTPAWQVRSAISRYRDNFPRLEK